MGSLSTASGSPPRMPAENPPTKCKIYLSCCPKDPQGRNSSNWIECFDTSSNTWDRVTSIPGLPTNHVLKDFSMVSVGENIFIIGGRLVERTAPSEISETRTELEVRRHVLRYNICENRWYDCAPLRVHRFDFACVVIGGKIFVAGGKVSRCSPTGTASAEVYDPALDEWQSLPDMSTPRHKCVGVTWQGKFHVIGGFAGNGDCFGNLRRSSAEVYDGEESRWNLILGMWQLDIPPNQIVAVDEKLFSSGDCLNSWKGQIESYDWKSNIWNEVEGSRFEALSATEFLTMAAAGSHLYFLAGYKAPDQISKMTSLVHVFDTSANGNAWSTIEAIEEEGLKELCSHCCVAILRGVD